MPIKILEPATEYNLDAMTIWELDSFIEAIGWEKCPRPAAILLFPDRRPGYITATIKLREYAMHRGLATSLRHAGAVECAKLQEQECDKIYKQLPKWAKGW